MVLLEENKIRTYLVLVVAYLSGREPELRGYSSQEG